MIIIAAFVWLMCCGMTLQASAASGSTAASARVVSGGKWVQTKDGRMYRYSKTSYAKNGWKRTCLHEKMAYAGWQPILFPDIRRLRKE